MIVTRPGNRSGHRTRLTGLLWRFSFQAVYISVVSGHFVTLVAEFEALKPP
jgi:hypothetical protein